MSNPQAPTRHCYRCGKEKLEQGTLRLLPGSTHITLCPDCYAVIWGWHEVLSTPAPDAQPRGEHPESPHE
jgi:hypothetical protein